MSINTENRKDEFTRIAKAVGAILGIPLTVLAIVQTIFASPINALIIAIVIAILISGWVIYSRWAGITEVILAWLALTVIVMAGYLVWPTTMTVSGKLQGQDDNFISGATVELFDKHGRGYETVTDAEGHYEFSNVPTGKIRIRTEGVEMEGRTRGWVVQEVEQSVTLLQAILATEAVVEEVGEAADFPDLRLTQVGSMYGCEGADLGRIPITSDRQFVAVGGRWDGARSTEKTLWIFLHAQPDTDVLSQKQITPQGRSRWNDFIVMPAEAPDIGRELFLSVLALDPETTSNIANGSGIRSLTSLGAGHHHQQVLIERVEQLERPVNVEPPDCS